VVVLRGMWTMLAQATPPPERPGWRPIRKIMAANRGEIAIRIFRAATELNIKTVAIYSKEDFGSLHRYKADESFLVGAGKSPIAAYLSAEEIVAKAVEHGVDAIHPGYGTRPSSARLSTRGSHARGCVCTRMV
jgi:pyruvate carboxylase